MYDMSIERLLKSFEKILRINLTDDSYTIIKFDRDMEGSLVERTNKISEWLQLFAHENYVYVEDIPLYMKYTSLSYMRRFFTRHDNHWVQYRRRSGNAYEWCEMEMITAEDYTDENQQIYLFVKKMGGTYEMAKEQESYSNGKKVLVVSGEEDCRELDRILKEKYEVLWAADTEEAFKQLEKQYEDVVTILIDAEKTMENGFLQIMKYSNRYSSIPIIALMREYSNEKAMDYMNRGVFDFFLRPFNSGIIKNRINSLVQLRYSMTMLNTLKRDPLTGLYTKPFFFKQVEEILAVHPEKSYRIVCTDVENFRLVNENYGVEAGDALLVYLAERIPAVMPNILVGGRLSSDVFVFLRENVPFTMDNAAWKELRKKAPVPNIVIKYGLATVDRSLLVQTMCDRALLAVQSIKKIYDRPFAEYNEEMQREKVREKQILDNMEDALSEQQFLVYYQPKHRIDDEKIGGAEALIRWIHPELGFMSPGEFIPLFEKNGFIVKVDEYARRQACMDLAKWRENGLPIVPVSVNLSRRDFENEKLVEEIIRLVDSFALPHELLHLEVTESVFSQNLEGIAEVVKKLRKNGFIIELDDFGSGYSSLTMLNSIELDVLKIDKSILDPGVGGSKNMILDFCVNLAGILKLKTVVEGVETKEQRDLLQKIGCDYIQGYYYSKPLPAKEFETYITVNQ